MYGVKRIGQAAACAGTAVSVQNTNGRITEQMFDNPEKYGIIE